MRNVLSTLSIVLCFAFSANAQIVTSVNNKDSAVGFYTGGSTLEVHNNVKSGSTSPVYLQWTVIDANFSPGWDMVGSGICDNNQCYSATNASNNLFNNNAQYFSSPYNNAAPGDFHMVFATSSPANGSSAYVRVRLHDTSTGTQGGSTRTLTFIGYKAATGISMTTTSSDNVVLYPIPAHDAVNVIFDENTGIRTIAVYNLIGKLMGPVYKPAANGSAKIDISDMPSGIYFLRLMDASGRVVATRRFTHQ